MNPNVKYSISVFDKHSEKYIGELNFINPIEIGELRLLLKIANDSEQLYDDYPIDSLAAAKIEKLTDSSLDLNKLSTSSHAKE
ncbi:MULTISPECIES: DUF7683 domain-containing protein [Pseudomonas]|uniref:DUF7683 domain-containing protein n=1 Tax=Pseudomonas TaxID=286 RepID=UPI00235D7C8D|nr:hypothetical protein [Pseudomonas putida]ELF6209354.1 hypothetical protein [Pseudomonas putida]GLO24890.1 hypothetical protein PPUJ21368_27180 [Pseudomonas putida]HDS0973176.1 hypothetical protein [Pseudomonas putida]